MCEKCEAEKLPMTLADALDRADAIMGGILPEGTGPDSELPEGWTPDWSGLTDDQRAIVTLAIKGQEQAEKADALRSIALGGLLGGGNGLGDLLASMMGGDAPDEEQEETATDEGMPEPALTPAVPRNDGNA